MAQPIGAVGGSLPPPQYLYPSQLFGAPVDVATNWVDLAAGDALPIPAGSSQYIYDKGSFSVVQFLDPVTGVWMMWDADRAGVQHIPSDGVTRRLANLTGCPVAAIIENGGTGFAQGTAAITSNVGGSLWQPIVGGSLTLSTINHAGANYVVPPLVLIPSPPQANSGNGYGPNNAYGGVPATAFAVLTGGSVSDVVFSNVGAGYRGTVNALLVPSPYDPNFGSITSATVTLIVDPANASKITAALCTNNGAPLATLSALTLTGSGGNGSGATITPVIMQTTNSSSLVDGGAGFGTASEFALVTSVGGQPTAASAIGNPIIEQSFFRPRAAQGFGTTNAGGTITGVTIMDAGLFMHSVTAAVVPANGGIAATAASITFQMGYAHDSVLLQPI